MNDYSYIQGSDFASAEEVPSNLDMFFKALENLKQVKAGRAEKARKTKMEDEAHQSDLGYKKAQIKNMEEGRNLDKLKLVQGQKKAKAESDAKAKADKSKALKDFDKIYSDLLDWEVDSSKNEMGVFSPEALASFKQSDPWRAKRARIEQMANDLEIDLGLYEAQKKKENEVKDNPAKDIADMLGQNKKPERFLGQKKDPMNPLDGGTKSGDAISEYWDNVKKGAGAIADGAMDVVGNVIHGDGDLNHYAKGRGYDLSEITADNRKGSKLRSQLRDDDNASAIEAIIKDPIYNKERAIQLLVDDGNVDFNGQKIRVLTDLEKLFIFDELEKAGIDPRDYLPEGDPRREDQVIDLEKNAPEPVSPVQRKATMGNSLTGKLQGGLDLEERKRRNMSSNLDGAIQLNLFGGR